MTLPIIPAALEILCRRWSENQDHPPSTFVFLSLNPTSKTGHLHDIRDSWEALLRRAGIEDFQVHDLRRSLGSWQTITGASPPSSANHWATKANKQPLFMRECTLIPYARALKNAVEVI
jgi:integrase